ncbi:glutaredoxin-dependent arsenate reductase [Proteus faecis]|uniref:Arsenate reductase n=1 Tax=Proteus faecis TaxID=2050967 RepID=A0ABZ3EFQ8_9GAMM
MNRIVIYHNPNCGTSRNTLEMIRNSGVEPEIIHYLETPPSKHVLEKLIADIGISVKALLRKNVEPYDKLDLDHVNVTDMQLIDYMMKYPILINRPIVVTPLGTRLCRPSEVVLDILPKAQKDAFSKEDGQNVVDEKGNRLI